MFTYASISTGPFSPVLKVQFPISADKLCSVNQIPQLATSTTDLVI